MKDFYAGMRANISQHACNGECMVGYDQRKDDDKKWVIISVADGAICYQDMSKEDVIKTLNKYEFVCQKALNKINSNKK